MSNKPDDGLTPREFAKLDGCSETLVRRKAKSGYLPVMLNGRISKAYVGTGWRKSAGPDAKPVSSVQAPELEARREDETRALLKGETAQPECPEWLQPAHEAENPFDKGVLFATLTFVRDIGAIAAVAAHDAGATIAAAKMVESTVSVMFIEIACDLMRGIGIGPFEHADDPPIWPREMGMRVNWRKVAADAGEPYEPKKWEAYVKDRKAALARECEAFERGEEDEAARGKKGGARKASRSSR